jgi:hypothetical protein
VSNAEERIEHSDMKATKSRSIELCEAILDELDLILSNSNPKQLSDTDLKIVQSLQILLSKSFSSLIETIEIHSEEEDEDAIILGKEPDCPLAALEYFDLGEVMLACAIAGSFMDASEFQRRVIKGEVAASAGAIGGKKSGDVRRAKRKWVLHAETIARRYVAENPHASQDSIASEISSAWKSRDVDPPGHMTLRSHVSKMQRDGTLPVLRRKTTKQLRIT